MSRCETCRSRGDCEDWCGVDVQEMYEKIQRLESQLEMAKKYHKIIDKRSDSPDALISREALEKIEELDE